MSKYKNLLVQYKGGGYDGCIWEWNFFFFDKDGNFHNIFSSGHNGIDDEFTVRDIVDGYDEHETYDATRESDIERFCKENTPPNVANVATWFDKNCQEVDFFVVCTKCGRHEQADEARLEGWHDCGGIESTTDHLLCRDCYGAGVCDRCNDWFDSDELITVGYDRICGYCCGEEE